MKKAEETRVKKMRQISDMINKEIITSKKLRELALDLKPDKSKKIREKQDYHYKKIFFLKKLNKAITESKKNEDI